ncbi:MAG: amino acid permease [Pirellulales bacterium]|nr:amino acid permease [Pirellulales bacterium]
MASNLPDYVASAQPVPQANRIPWFSSTAQTYAGIMLWFVFWQDIPTGGGAAGGTLSHGVGLALLGVILAGLLCHFLYYVVPGMLGMKTGLPLYIVGTSTYGVNGGFLMPGFLMGILQFGWLGVNAFFAGVLLCAPFYENPMDAVLTPPHAIVSSIWAILAAFMGLKGISYVAKVATFLPVIPLAILIILFVSTVGGVGSFDPAVQIDAPAVAKTAPKAKADTDTNADDKAETKEDAEAKAVAEDKAGAEKAVEAEVAAAPLPEKLTKWGVVAIILTYIIGFFATAGAAGADFGMNNRDAKDVSLGGLVGIAGSTIFAGGLSLLIVAGAYGSGLVEDSGVMNTTALMGGIVGTKTAAVFMYLLAIAAFPPACFSSFIAANSFKTTLPKVPPFLSVGIGTAVSIFLAISGYAGDVISVFSVIGASFGPICGAMAADYLLSGKNWAGPRAGFNPAGWISWAVGFVVGAADFIPALAGKVPVPPLAALIVGFVLYLILAKAGLESTVMEMPAAETE